jgi:sulfur relay (sulfurtransferase) complex TusBCD TusD component (DsrE family)
VVNEPDYYSNRAEQQLRMAERATNQNVCNSHYRLANLLLERAPGLSKRDEPGQS